MEWNGRWFKLSYFRYMPSILMSPPSYHALATHYSFTWDLGSPNLLSLQSFNNTFSQQSEGVHGLLDGYTVILSL